MAKLPPPKNYYCSPLSYRKRPCTEMQIMQHARLHPPDLLAVTPGPAPHVRLCWDDPADDGISEAVFSCAGITSAILRLNRFRKVCTEKTEIVSPAAAPGPTAAEKIRLLKQALRNANNLLMDIYNTSPMNSIAFQRFPRLNTTNLHLLNTL